MLGAEAGLCRRVVVLAEHEQVSFALELDRRLDEVTVAQPGIELLGTSSRRPAAGMAQQFAPGLAHRHTLALILAAQFLQQ